MIYAIATTDQQLAHRFSKAELFTFYNQQQEVIAVDKNPALASPGCTGKRLLIDLLHKRGCDVVIVRKIGEKTLAKLLHAGFKVEQGNTRHSYQELLTAADLHKNALTSPEQGVKSKMENCGKH
ncbi:MAG: putative Fe-Mo cluster-binding NifX family protein [Psychromonas sp.]|jgi:predicted Fe-Mo cluster-binding NifX family protein|uniref:NifB/NifX family molybdenum-iron cluster-binding protein n=1 Tax=Psychromonas sp. TaxID=1884585 RepID=UPI0039E66A06